MAVVLKEKQTQQLVISPTIQHLLLTKVITDSAIPSYLMNPKYYTLHPGSLSSLLPNTRMHEHTYLRGLWSLLPIHIIFFFNAIFKLLGVSKLPTEGTEMPIHGTIYLQGKFSSQISSTSGQLGNISCTQASQESVLLHLPPHFLLLWDPKQRPRCQSKSFSCEWTITSTLCILKNPCTGYATRVLLVIIHIYEFSLILDLWKQS